MTLNFSVWAAGALSQGFKTSDNAPIGSLMTLQPRNEGFVQLATSDQAPQLVGIASDKALIALSSDTKQVQVVTSGVTTTLVSDINGDIKVGDKITASPLEGIGMKTKVSSQVVGIAQSNLASSATSQRTVKDKAGKTAQVKIGAISVQVNVSYYSVPQDKLSSYVPTFLVNAGSAIAGKDLSPTRVLVGFFCLLIGFIIAGIMLQVAVRSGIISIGRNPLAHDVLQRSLVDVLVTSIGVLLLTGVIFYLILTV